MFGRDVLQLDRAHHFLMGASGLDGGPDGDVADLDVVGLFDGEGDGAGNGLRRDREVIHALSDQFLEVGVVDGVGEVRADVPGRDGRGAQRAVGGLLSQALEEGADRVFVAA